MRRPERIDEILEKIRDEWIQNSELRLGQLLITKFNYPEGDIFNVEDSIFEVDEFS